MIDATESTAPQESADRSKQRRQTFSFIQSQATHAGNTRTGAMVTKCRGPQPHAPNQLLPVAADSRQTCQQLVRRNGDEEPGAPAPRTNPVVAKFGVNQQPQAGQQGHESRLGRVPSREPAEANDGYYRERNVYEDALARAK